MADTEDDTDGKASDVFDGPPTLYSDAARYWSGVAPTVDGMLGGFGTGSVPRVDANGSRSFIASPAIKARLAGLEMLRAADCGAGIGRVTRDVLSRVATTVDIVEPTEVFAREAEHGGTLQQVREAGKLGTVYHTGLERWHPEPGTYGLIWCQWCIGHLKDVDLVAFLERAARALVSADSGVIVVKENISTGESIFDKTDSSVTRTESAFERVFASAGLKILAKRFQTGFPPELFPVVMYALVPGRGERVGEEA